MEDNLKKYENLDKSKFVLATNVDRSHDEKLNTKPVGYFKDAWRRFRKNKASLVALGIIVVLVLFALIGPFFGNKKYQAAYQTDTIVMRYQYLKPRIGLFYGTGIWDGTQKKEVSETVYQQLRAKEQETGQKVIVRVLREYTDETGKKMRKILIDTYTNKDIYTLTLLEADYLAIQEYQNETGIQVILPYSENELNNFNVWFKADQRLKPEFDAQGNYIPNYLVKGEDLYNSIRLEKDPFNTGDTENRWRYAKRTGTAATGYNYVVRVNPYNYFVYRYGFEPSFIFGTDKNGYDIFSRLASGARFSLMLAVIVAAVNLTIGAIYGAIEGYYGGVTDMVMERVSDILSGIPFMVVTVLFQLHLAGKVGVVPSLIYAFVLTGWIGMAGRVRMQFYRYKNQEYILAARTLGAKDWRIMFKHIFPNSLGTIITGSVLVIPGVIFGETSLTYLGIINLDSPTMSSVGSMLSNGQAQMTAYPHMILFPALFIALLEISFNLFGNGLRDAFNPSLRGSEEE